MTAADRSDLARDLTEVTDATVRLTLTADDLTVDDLAAPSLLPGWTRAHVLGHVARNAEGMARLVDWAFTGRPSPMYASAEDRAAGIESAAGLPAADLRRLLDESGARLDAAVRRLLVAPDEALERPVVFGPMRPGVQPDVPAFEIGWARLREVEIHHVDLGCDYVPSAWPAAFVERMIAFLDSRSPAPAVTGDAADVVAWRLGRGTGRTLRTADGGVPGDPPAW